MLMPSSEQWGGIEQTGKYAVKIYTIDGVLIYQEELGITNAGKAPLGGVVYQDSPASSMDSTILNPITFYGSNSSVVNQSEHSKDLYDYYWTSYSRGTDGTNGNMNWHNVYLDGYIPLRAKSIYDPCPYLYRIPSNGTWNQFSMQSGWITNSYLGGVSWNLNTMGESWLSALGARQSDLGTLGYTGIYVYLWTTTIISNTSGYFLLLNSEGKIYVNESRLQDRGFSVRCIEDCNMTKM